VSSWRGHLPADVDPYVEAKRRAGLEGQGEPLSVWADAAVHAHWCWTHLRRCRLVLLGWLFTPSDIVVRRLAGGTVTIGGSIVSAGGGGGGRAEVILSDDS
jgi:hypothetical protein